MLAYLAAHDIGAVFHYVPLHSSEGGRKFGRFFGEDVFTTKESERLIRLPMWYGLRGEEITKVAKVIETYIDGV